MNPSTSSYRTAIAEYIAREARPAEKFGHQPRLYALTRTIGHELEYDDDVVYAAAWLHDLGVFIGHRPEDPKLLGHWDHVQYAVEKLPGVLSEAGFPTAKVPAVLDAIRTHQPKDEPTTIEATILRDADILEQLGAVGVLRAVSKVGKDTRFTTYTQAIGALRRVLYELPAMLRLEVSRALARPRIAALDSFLRAVENEAGPSLF
ncbi:MAG TPA: HD domain-containing protein [Acidisarcina sp.]